MLFFVWTLDLKHDPCILISIFEFNFFFPRSYRASDPFILYVDSIGFIRYIRYIGFVGCICLIHYIGFIRYVRYTVYTRYIDFVGYSCYMGFIRYIGLKTSVVLSSYTPSRPSHQFHR